jgi:hypothetical protein
MIPINQMIHNHFSLSGGDSGGQNGPAMVFWRERKKRRNMQEVVLRMRRVSEDLREIRKRLEELRGSNEAHHQVVDEVLELDLIREFKSSVDQVRLFLWDYFQAAAHMPEPEPDQALKEFRLRRATEMLQSVQNDITMPTTPDTDVKSLFERLHDIADIAVERHFATPKDGEK